MTEYTPVKPTKDSQTIEVLKLVISAVDRAAKTARLNAEISEMRRDAFVEQEFDCIAQDLEYFLSEMKLAGISVYTAGTKTKTKQYLNERYI